MKRIEAIAAPVREQAVTALRDAITSGQFAPGQRLIEKDLCESLGISRGSVREALRQLEAEQLIRNVPNHGPIVAKLSARDVHDIYQIREALEGLAIKLFVTEAKARHFATLGEAVEAMSRAYDADDYRLSLIAKEKFYQTLFEGSGNPMIPGILRTMDARINIVRRLALASGERSTPRLQQFRDLVAALRRGDGAGAVAISETLLGAAAASAIAMLAAAESESVGAE